jgi:hypothetical protein
VTSGRALCASGHRALAMSNINAVLLAALLTAFLFCSIFK